MTREAGPLDGDQVPGIVPAVVEGNPRLTVEDPDADALRVEKPARPSPGPRARKGPIAALVIGIAAAVGALSLYETGNALTARFRTATDADWQAATFEVRGSFEPGDLIVFAPSWADQLGRFYLGDLIPPEMAARSDSARYKRIWEVSIRGERAPETLANDALPVSWKKFGRVRVNLYDRTHVAPPLHDFTERLADARVVQTPGGEPWENPCLRDGDAVFRCSTTRVERRILEVDYKPRRGVLVPVDGRLITELEWKDVKLGSELVVYGGLHDYYARKNADGLVLLKVFVDGEQVLEAPVRNNDGWKRFSISTTRFKEKSQAARVRFEVSAPNAAWRNFGFHAETRDAEPELVK